MFPKTLSRVIQGARTEEQELAEVAEETRKPEQKQVGITMAVVAHTPALFAQNATKMGASAKVS